MSGFPTRFSRTQLGPKFRDNYPVENPETDIGAQQFNAAFWQVAGINLIVPRVSLIAVWGGSSFTINHQAEAWNPDNAQAHPVLARTSAGVYTYTFASTYTDEDGVAISLALLSARVTVHKALTAFADRVVGFVWKDGSNPLILQIRLWKETDGTAVDEPFWLEAF